METPVAGRDRSAGEASAGGRLPGPSIRAHSARRALPFTHGWLILPGLLLLAGTFVFPLILLLSRSVFDPDLTLDHYRRMLTDTSYLRVLWLSVEIALVSTVISLVLAYPVSYYLTRTSPFARALIISLVLVPFWTNILVRSYAWMVLLQHRGILNILLVDHFGILENPLSMMYNYTGVIVGMVHYLLPPAILILYTINSTIDMRLVQAAESLGAPPLRAFYRIFLPLSMPGVRAAGVLIFILGLGFFVTPALLGGRREITVAMLINEQFTQVMNWGFGSALAVVLLVMTLLGIMFYYRTLPQRSTIAGET